MFRQREANFCQVVVHSTRCHSDSQFSTPKPGTRFPEGLHRLGRLTANQIASAQELSATLFDRIN